MELAAAVERRDDVRTLVLLLAPLAPHLAEELWCQLGGEFSMHEQPRPEAEEVEAEQVTVIVQIDGKRRGRLVVRRGTWDVNEPSPEGNLGIVISLEPLSAYPVACRTILHLA